MRLLTASLLCITLAVTSRAQVEAPGISVTTRLVAVPTVVRDKHGALVNGLKQSDFALRVDGKPQSLRYFDHESNVPLTLGLLVDTSQSQRKILDEEKTASTAFLDKMLSPTDKAFLLQFDVKILLLQDVTDERPLLEKSLLQLSVPEPDYSQLPYFGVDGPQTQADRMAQMEARHAAHRLVVGTKLFDAVNMASADVTAKQPGRRALILLTDGGDYGSVHSLDDAVEAAQRADTIVYAIYYSAPVGPMRELFGTNGEHILKRLCSETGGYVFDVTDKQSVEDIYAKIAEELRSQYRLGFTPSPDDAGKKYHRIDLKLTGEAAKGKPYIQTRDGYYPAGTSTK